MKTLSLILTFLMVAGCSVISKETRKEVDPDITLDMVQKNPDQYIGKKVLWGGIILSSENLEKTTEIEVLETELGYDQRPENGQSRGRFLIESNRYLDTSIYKENKRITAAGTVQRVETRKIGRMDYLYPVISPIEMKLSEKPPEDAYSGMAPWYGYGPYGPYGPAYPYPGYPFGPYPWGPYPYWPYPYRPLP